MPLTKAASAEYGRQGIRVNCLCPGFIETEIMGASGGSQSFGCQSNGGAVVFDEFESEKADLPVIVASVPV